MILKDTKEKLLQGMTGPLEKFEFSFYKSQQSFKRPIHDGVQTLYFLIYKKNDEIFVDPRWSIEFKSMADIYHKITLKSPEFFKDTVVLENSLFQIIEYVDNKNERGTSNSKK